MEGMIPRIAARFEAWGGQLDDWARELKVVRRERNISGRQLVLTLVCSWWHDPQATWDDLAANAGRWFGVRITPQALHERAGQPPRGSPGAPSSGREGRRQGRKGRWPARK